ncbi:2-oxoacid:acceptor oxidoreductase subunit alpha [Rhodopirellula sp. JC740]|uniref:2-oxoacid:acceptor oxidoreductase subunit alpha n=1 Tax=Rhodopirellula halodulae TaxID=2894198 RepID=A0ABS8NCJ8_9BACT|nr:MULTISPECIES: 2-oxoacid:acceptor oxidoreductase subunit alpha [unclassified Rhodopirellula]MCC9641273.1 2-oxoacid:acceptor oxidoreductase subunit alpha [Rhodopirellula sp. JC740]MCC9657681.1 2-oxoacid:acceptor oxidoreductase subunit alpha [Rhodopirellula sp. JC737]
MTTSTPTTNKKIESVSGITVRLCGDSGDGMQLLGTQLTNTSALAGNDVATFPDFPAEIRAPRGTRAGVSGFQVQFASEEIFTPGDTLDALVVMNPAAMVTNIGDLRKGGILIANEDGFNDKEYKLAKVESNPLEADVIQQDYRLVKVAMTKLTREAVSDFGLSTKIADRCKNFFAMGLVYWLFGRSLDPTLRFIEAKFGKKPDIAAANVAALRAGWAYGETTEEFSESYQVEAAELTPGTYRNIMGNQAIAWGLIAASKLSGKEMFYGTYPITPASDILHELTKFKNFGVRTFQAEDEIAAIGATIGAAFGGTMAVTASSGPGIALKGEAMGLGVMLELPMIVINVQRGGPSTGLPTKTEQSDLLQGMFGRNGEAPMPILAPRSPGDCFEMAVEAWRIATECMVPVMLLSDGYIANGSEPWKIPDMDELPKIQCSHPGEQEGDEPFLPYARNENLARPWAIPGTAGLMHRVGGLEKEDGTGNVSYDPANHQHMCDTRAAKVAKIAERIPEQDVFGETSGDVLVVSWGGTYGACHTAVNRCRQAGHSVSHAHIRYINPLPRNIGELLKSFKTVLVPELNAGQLRMLLRAEYLVDCIGINKIQGKPFAVSELVEAISQHTSTQQQSKAG